MNGLYSLHQMLAYYALSHVFSLVEMSSGSSQNSSNKEVQFLVSLGFNEKPETSSINASDAPALARC